MTIKDIEKCIANGDRAEVIASLILWDYSNWLAKKGYLDSDYYTEEPKAVDWYLSERK